MDSPRGVTRLSSVKQLGECSCHASSHNSPNISLPDKQQADVNFTLLNLPSAPQQQQQSSSLWQGVGCDGAMAALMNVMNGKRTFV
jgi:hypothetical protein